MEPLRTERVASNFTPDLFAQLVAYAKAHHLSLSTALFVLAESGLTAYEQAVPVLRSVT